MSPKSTSKLNNKEQTVPKNRGLRIAFLIVPLLATSEILGDEQQCEPATVVESPDLYNQIEGSIEPEKIPDFLKYRRFVTMYSVYIDDLVQELTSRDHTILDALTVGTEHWQISENARYVKEFLSLCTNRFKMDAVTLARESERIAAESNARGADRTRNAIESLSSAGRLAVETYIEETITPKLSFPLTNSVDLALKDPDDFMYGLEIMCHTYTNGEPPPEVQRMMECLRQQPAVEPAIGSPKPTVRQVPRSEN